VKPILSFISPPDAGRDPLVMGQIEALLASAGESLGLIDPTVSVLGGAQ